MCFRIVLGVYKYQGNICCNGKLFWTRQVKNVIFWRDIESLLVTYLIINTASSNGLKRLSRINSSKEAMTRERINLVELILLGLEISFAVSHMSCVRIRIANLGGWRGGGEQ